MIFKNNLNCEAVSIEKSIKSDLENKNLFVSVDKDTADAGVELLPPVSMRNCLYVFENSSYVAKSARILANDVLFNNITLSSSDLNDDDNVLKEQVKQIQEYLMSNIDELYNLAVDYYYSGWGAIEYVWNNTQFSLKQIPIHTCKIKRITINKEYVFLLEQKINSKTKYFKIMGETYPDDFLFYNNEKLGYAAIIGGDNIYQFYSLPYWVQDYKKILTQIAIAEADYKTVANGNISSGILNINLEPQIAPAIEYDQNGNVIDQTSRQEIIENELINANGGTAVIFTESNRPVKLDYVNLTNNNYSYLSDLGDKCQQAVLNDYNIPLTRLMINTEKESMNSNKTQSIWEIYTLNLRNEQKKWKQFINELIFELYGMDLTVDIDVPMFSDRREIEVKLLIDAWKEGALTLEQYITGLSEYINVINLDDYDFTVNRGVWEYRNLNIDNVNPDDEVLIDEVEKQLNELRL